MNTSKETIQQGQQQPGEESEMNLLRLHQLIFTIAMVGLLLPGQFAYGVEVSATVDRNPIYLDESVNLVVTVQGELMSNSAPDLTAIADDFAILQQSSQTNITVQDNTPNVVQSWIYEIQPKRLGNLEIPSLAVAGEKTVPVQIEVREFKGNVTGEGAEIFLETAVSSENPYVQSQVNFTTRLYYSIPIVNGELTNPEFDFGTVERRGPDKRYNAKRAGVNYRVIERGYAIFPEQSGEHSISSIEFTCLVERADPVTQQSIHVRERYSSKAVSIEVRPAPRSYTGSTWLPAQDMRLIDSWNGKVPQFEIGKPESRQISIAATGLRAVQLPMVSFQEADTARIYSGNNAQLETSKTNDWIVARRTDEFAIIPQSDQTVEVPEFRLVWWDVVEDREKIAIIPSISVQIGQPKSQLSQPREIADSQPEESLLPMSETGVLGADRQWKLISLALLTIWLLTLLSWFYSRRNKSAQSIEQDSADDQNVESERKALRRIQQACRECDAVETGRCLLEWAAIRWADNPPRNLIDLGQRLGGEELVAQLERLDRVSFSSETQTWDGQAVWQRLSKALRAAKTKPKKSRRLFWSKSPEEELQDLWLGHKHSAP